MAIGQDQTGGLFARPDVTSIGVESWAQMAGVHPSSPLVGGRGVPDGGIQANYPYSRVAVSGTASNAPVPSHVSEILNFKQSPMPWLLGAAILYLGLIHLHVNGTAGFGVGRGKK
ncbi:MAG: hypothetical protein M3Y09_20205 [Actinomycetota bacterium]|nr:hypothetical protein [Actinomycetota bacterium]